MKPTWTSFLLLAAFLVAGGESSVISKGRRRGIGVSNIWTKDTISLDIEVGKDTINTTLEIDLPLINTQSYRNLEASYVGNDFFDGFNFYTGEDPTDGFVQYLDRTTAASSGIIASSSSNVYIGVDHTNVTTKGRPSVRLESKQQFTHGLFVLDAAHIPGSVCGTWPAFWTVGDNWPSNGEIDIIEGVHQQAGNNMALHTSDGCVIDGTAGGSTAALLTTDCYVDAEGQSSNAGCAFHDYSAGSYGDGFNSNPGGGGAYAMEWNDEFIKIWWFARDSIPADMLGENPEPMNWGTPAATFTGDGFNVDDHFEDHRIVIDITFCGSWAGNVWGTSGCQYQADTCDDFVANNPSAFTESYWLINSLKVWSS